MLMRANDFMSPRLLFMQASQNRKVYFNSTLKTSIGAIRQKIKAQSTIKLMTVDRAPAIGCVFGDFLPCIDFFIFGNRKTLPSLFAPLTGDIFAKNRAVFTRFFDYSYAFYISKR